MVSVDLCAYIVVHSCCAASMMQHEMIITLLVRWLMRLWCVRDSRGSDMEQPRLLLNQPPGPLVVLAVPGRACLVWQAAGSRRPAIGRRWQVRAAVAHPGGGRWLVVSRASVASRQWMVSRPVAREGKADDRIEASSGHGCRYAADQHTAGLRFPRRLWNEG